MARRKHITSLAPTEVKDDKLAKFRITDETEQVRYDNRVYRVKKVSRSGRILAISRGHGTHEEFFWVHVDLVTVVPPKPPKREPKAKKVPRPKKAAKDTKAPRSKPAAKKAARKTATKTPQRGGKKVK